MCNDNTHKFTNTEEAFIAVCIGRAVKYLHEHNPIIIQVHECGAKRSRLLRNPII